MITLITCRPWRLFLGSLSLFVVVSAPAQAADLKEGVDTLAVQLAKSVPEGRVIRVAVTDFPDLQGVTSNLGRYIAERLTTRLSAQAEKFRVIERRRLGLVLGELKFSMSDLVDPAKAKQLGKMLGVEALVVGSVSDLGNQVDVDARIIEIETNNILPGVTASLSKDQVVTQLITEGRTGPTVTPPVTPTIGSTGTTSRPPGVLAKREFVDKLVRIQVESAGLDEKGQLRLAVLYMNPTDEAKRAGLHDSYVVDARGGRRNLVSTSLPQGNQLVVQPESRTRIWLIFDKGIPRGGVFDFFSKWQLCGAGCDWVDVSINDVLMRD